MDSAREETDMLKDLLSKFRRQVKEGFKDVPITSRRHFLFNATPYRIDFRRV
jgi:hypothetical protein